MKKLLGIAVTVPLLFGGLAACGGGDETTTSTPVATAEATPMQTLAASPTTEATDAADPTSAVERYCKQVDEYAAKAKEILANPTSTDATELQAKAQELQQTASELTQELIDDPSQATRVEECTTKLQEALAG